MTQEKAGHASVWPACPGGTGRPIELNHVLPVSSTVNAADATLASNLVGLT